MYTVKEVAQLLELTEHTIRYYTDKGLVPSVQRDKNNNRLFDDESINWLTGVKYLKQCGMSVKDIKTYVDLCLEGDATIEERYEIILKQKEIALQRLEEAKRTAEYMEEKAKHYLDIINHVIPDDTNPGKWEKMER
ncbi:MerR family transcriptional regulator [Weizmannia acidilactici]|uniref:MerR family transcriptional regulator n=1 Tax=Weizmannia acidilactici TaxID=2607726 RepID=A0A5J4JI08_9BACI|nr:MerR family transcriptional regulator [Weizmannia acidilactici]GER70087.1 MerR family transcriptional regulator [Weizmannia acidilactici]GER74157.1 MerR family transcriptional regulator [Weizmannia acidilactici]